MMDIDELFNRDKTSTMNKPSALPQKVELTDWEFLERLDKCARLFEHCTYTSDEMLHLLRLAHQGLAAEGLVGAIELIFKAHHWSDLPGLANLEHALAKYQEAIKE